MAKKFIQNTFEQLAELGGSTIKRTASSLVDIINPLPKHESTPGTPKNFTEIANLAQKEGQAQNPDHTKLDLDQLQQSYGNTDQQSADAVRKQLFSLGKRNTQEMQNNEQQTQHFKAQEAADAKQRKAAVPTLPQLEPQGKKSRGGLFSRKKPKTNMALPELKPSTSKS